MGWNEKEELGIERLIMLGMGRNQKEDLKREINYVGNWKEMERKLEKEYLE